MGGLRIRPYLTPIHCWKRQEHDTLPGAPTMGRGVVPEIDVDLLAYQDDAAEAD